MNEEIHCIRNNEGKQPGMNGKIMTPTFFELYTMYIKKLGQFFSILHLIYIILLQVINIFKS